MTGLQFLVGTGGSLGLTVPAISPAGYRVVCCDGAGVVHAGRQALIGARRGVSLTVPVISPAGNGVVGGDGARMLAAHYSGFGGAGGCVGRASAFHPQHLTLPSVAMPHVWYADRAVAVKVPSGASV